MADADMSDESRALGAIVMRIATRTVDLADRIGELRETLARSEGAVDKMRKAVASLVSDPSDGHHGDLRLDMADAALHMSELVSERERLLVSLEHLEQEQLFLAEVHAETGLTIQRCEAP